MTDYHVMITDGEHTNSLVCTSALDPDAFADYLYNTLIADLESKTIAYVKYIDVDGRWQSFDVQVTLGR